MPFDKNLWCKTGDLGSFPGRELMVNDLIENHKYKGLKYRELISMLGEQSGSYDSTKIFNNVRVN